MKLKSLLASALVVATLGVAHAGSFADTTGVKGLKLQAGGGYAQMTANPSVKKADGSFENVTGTGANFYVKPTVDFASYNGATFSVGATVEYATTTAKDVDYGSYKVSYAGNSFYVAPVLRTDFKVTPNANLFVDFGVGLNLGKITVAEKTSTSSTTTTANTTTTTTYTTSTDLNGYKPNLGAHVSAGVEYNNVVVDVTYKNGVSVAKPDFNSRFTAFQVGYRF